MHTSIRAEKFRCFGHTFWRGFFLAGLLCTATLPLAAQSVPGNYTTGNLTFPRQPAPQYVAVDLGNATVLDMNDNGAVLTSQNDPDTGYYDYYLWSGGNVTTLPSTDDDGNEYYWEFVANDGEVLGQAWGNPEGGPGILGMARWNSTDGASTMNIFDNIGDFVPDDAYGWDWGDDQNYNRNGDLYFGVYYSVQEVLATDYFDNPVGPINSYYVRAKWSADGGSLTQVGDTLFFAGDAIHETPDVTISYPIATAPGNITLNQVFANTTYVTPSSTEIDYVSGEYLDEDDDPVWEYSSVYYDNTYEPSGYYPPLPVLQLNGTTMPQNDFFADFDSPDMTRIIAGLNHPLILNYYDNSLSGDDETLDYLQSGNFTEANLTANISSNTALYFYQINSLGFGLSQDDLPWLNGADLQWSDVLPAADVNMDGSANFTALLPAASLSANIYYTLTNLAENSTAVAGWLVDLDTYNERSFLLVPAALAVDMNRDGNISFDVDDQTSEDSPFVFWLNNDVDRMGVIEANVSDDLNPADYSGNLDWNLNTIPCTRDLEDFARLWLNIGSLQSSISSGNIYVGLKWEDFSGNIGTTTTPAIKLYTAYGNGTADYLTNSTIAADQLTGNYANALTNVDGSENSTLIQPTSNDWDFILPQSVFANLTSTNSTVHFLFEGCRTGQGELSLVLLHYNGTGYTKIGAGGGSVAFDLEDVKSLYERWTVGDGPSSGELNTWLTGEGGGGVPNSTANISADRLPSGVTGANFTDDEPGDYKYILLVHGWNMQPWEKDVYAETAFKRLYWQGYQGRFGAFQWPTTYHTSDIAAIQDYDLGEYSAWLSAKPLENLLTDTLASRYGSGNISVLAHSMGNVVTGEALRLAANDGNGQIVNAYVASQAAVPVHNYDPSQTIPGDFWGFRVVYSSINILGHNWLNIPVYASASTPNIYPNWFRPVSSSGSSVVNFYNTNDFALNLAHWQTNQGLKPDGWIYPVGYGTTGTNPYGYSSSNYTVVADDFYNTTSGNNSLHLAAVSGNFAVGNTTYGSNVNDEYQIMSFAAQAQCAPLGASSGVGNMSGNFSLQSLWPFDSVSSAHDYSDHAWHSAEFRFDNMGQDPYWNELMKKFGLPSNHNSSP